MIRDQLDYKDKYIGHIFTKHYFAFTGEIAPAEANKKDMFFVCFCKKWVNITISNH